MAHPNDLTTLDLNAVRLWYLNEDHLVRLSTGTVASNAITSKTIICYSIAKRTGISQIFIYADSTKVARVDWELTFARQWRSVEHREDGTEIVGYRQISKAEGTLLRCTV